MKKKNTINFNKLLATDFIERILKLGVTINHWIDVWWAVCFISVDWDKVILWRKPGVLYDRMNDLN